MSRQVLGAVFMAACVVSSPALAQSVLGVARTPGVTFHRADPPKEEPAPPPARPPHSHDHGAHRPAPGSDLFLAGPDTYAPYDPRRPSRLPVFPVLSGYVPTVYTPTVFETVVVQREIVIDRAPRSRETTTERETTPEPAPPPMVIYAAPVKQKTLYIIPRCYAGDKPPSPDQLPAGCDIALLKVIPAPD